MRVAKNRGKARGAKRAPRHEKRTSCVGRKWQVAREKRKVVSKHYPNDERAMQRSGKNEYGR